MASSTGFASTNGIFARAGTGRCAASRPDASSIATGMSHDRAVTEVPGADYSAAEQQA